MLFGFSYKQGEESEAARKHTKRQAGELRESTQRDQQWFLVLNHRSAHPKSSTGPPIYTEAMWLETDVGTLGTHSRLFSVKAYGKSNWRSMLVYSTYWVRATGGACFSLMCLVQYLLSTRATEGACSCTVPDYEYEQLEEHARVQYLTMSTRATEGACFSLMCLVQCTWP